MKRSLAALALAATLACSSAPPREEAPARVLASGLDPSNFDRSVRPQDDLFRAVNGGWLARTPIPNDRSSYGAFHALGEKCERDLKAIIDEVAVGGGTGEAQQVGDLYASFMDEARVNALGLAPVAPELAAIRALATPADLARRLGALRRTGGPGAFHVWVGADAKRSDRHVVTVAQGGLGLPDRDYYLLPKYREKLLAYEPHVARVLALAGVADASSAAAAVVALETELARAHWSKTESRDDVKTYNKLGRAALPPGFAWDAYLDAAGLGAVTELVVAQPSSLAAFAELVASVPLETWRAWLAWHLLHHEADRLGSDLVELEFAFYGKTLRGIPEQRPRWKRGVSVVQSNLGEALGKLYVARHFPPEAKARVETLVANLIAAFRERIGALEWMGPATKEKALAKLATFLPKIGYPKKWRDYSSVAIRRDDLVGNVHRAAAAEWERNLAKLGRPVDRDEWFMTPQTVNAYYNSSANEIVFPAAILQPPFFDPGAEDAVNYGGIGAVIGHEIGHGFDDQGSRWDAAGNLVDWWTKEDRAEFERRGAALAAQYDRFEPLPGFKVNGRLTLGENMGDLAGATVAHAAYRLSLGGKPAPVIDGLTGDQRFFYGFARIWRGKLRDDELRIRLATDPHSPPEYRANGTVRNVPAFHEAFGVKEGDRMFLPAGERVRIW